MNISSTSVLILNMKLENGTHTILLILMRE